MFRPARRLDVSPLFRFAGAGLILLAAGCSASSVNGRGSTGGSGAGGGASSGNGTGASGGGMLGGGAGGSASGGGIATGGTGTAGRPGENGTGGGASPDAAVSDAGGVDPLPPSDGGPGSLGGGPVGTSMTHLDIAIHDPSMIWDGSKYYLFRTNNLGIRSSSTLTDSTQWAASNVVLPTFLPGIPPWVTTAVPGVRGLWAPDISYFSGKFHVYYAGSTFGSFTSVIGLATNATLDSTRPGYAWLDEGLIVQTRDRIDSYNAIDPNVAFDATGAPWLAFGSFGSGIKLHKLDATTGKFATDDPTLYSIASRNGVANGAIEAPSIISHNGYFYLFVSFDLCCQGLSSTYRTMAGRASAITGPYADSTGKPMLDSGGDQLIATTGRYIGPGGGTAWKDGDNYLYVYHYYDGMTPNGASKLLVRPITFSADDWIVLGDPLFP